MLDIMNTADTLLRLIQIKYPQLNAYASTRTTGLPVLAVYVDSQDGTANLVDIYYVGNQLTIHICRGEEVHVSLAQEGSIDIIYNCIGKAIELEYKARAGLNYKRRSSRIDK